MSDSRSGTGFDEWITMNDGDADVEEKLRGENTITMTQDLQYILDM